MSVFDFFRKEKEEKKPARREAEEKVGRKGPAQAKKLENAFSYLVIEHQHITEKASDLMALNKYTFQVFKSANKDLVRKAVEKLYGVKVKDVNMINIPPKPVRLGRFEGKKGGYKKAIVTLREGHKIDIAPH